jgi:cytochrome d ubiquinol oxidase subunit II
LLSSAFLPLLVVLVGLIGRGVAFEYRGKVDSVRWRRNWDRVIVAGSLLPALGVGMVLSWNVLGLPIDAWGDRVGSAFAAFQWETLLGALAVVGYSLVHGAVFVALKTSGDIHVRARSLALRIGPIAVLPLVGLLVLVQVRSGSWWTLTAIGIVVVALASALQRLAVGRDGQAFALMAVAVVGTMVTLFGALYPNVLPSTVDPAFSLTIQGAASSPYTLEVMTWVAALGAPAVLVYQGWTYWVFRKRIATSHIPPVHVP